MKKLIAALVLTGVSAMPAFAADYVIDTKGAHASVQFKIKHLGYSWLTGRFDKFDGKFSYDDANVAASKISVNIDTQSLNSNHAERDKHLRSPEFLSTDKYPSARFVSSSVEKVGENLKIKGKLTLRGVTKDVVIDAEKIGEGKDPWGGYRAGFSGTTSLSLKDYGIRVLGASTHAEMTLHLEGIRI